MAAVKFLSDVRRKRVKRHSHSAQPLRADTAKELRPRLSRLAFRGVEWLSLSLEGKETSLCAVAGVAMQNPLAALPGENRRRAFSSKGEEEGLFAAESSESCTPRSAGSSRLGGWRLEKKKKGTQRQHPPAASCADSRAETLHSRTPPEGLTEAGYSLADSRSRRERGNLFCLFNDECRLSRRWGPQTQSPSGKRGGQVYLEVKAARHSVGHFYLLQRRRMQAEKEIREGLRLHPG